MQTRRQFLAQASAALGGTLLTACTTSSPQPALKGAPIPSGYRFVSLKSSGAGLPSGGKLKRFRLDATLNAQGQIVYGAFDDSSASGALGIYSLTLDLSAAHPRVVSEKKVVRLGDALEGNRTVRGLGNYASNRAGHLAIIVKPTEGQSAIYLDRGTGLKPLLESRQLTVDGHRLEGIFGDLDLHDNDDLICVERYVHQLQDGRQEARQGLFFVPEGDPRKTRLLESTGRFLPGGGAVTRSLGLIDLHDNGEYVAQVFSGPPRRDSVQALSSEPSTAVLRGNTSSAGASRLVAADRSLGFRPQGLAESQLGEVVAGPRIGPGALTTTLLHLTDEACVLLYGPQKVIQTGEKSPLGYAVTAITPGVVGTGSLLYFVLTTRQGDELCVFNGEETRVLLSSGDRIGTDARPLEGIAFGYMPDAVDPEGRLVLFAQYPDGSAQLVLALPR